MLWVRVGYALLCIIVPIAWGLVVYWASNAIEKRVLRGDAKGPKSSNDQTTLPLDYHI